MVIFGTGYDVPLGFLPALVQQTLAFDAEDHVKPHLAHRTTFHPDLPNFALVGMIRGALFGIMEAQARWAAAVFSGRVALPTRQDMLEGIDADRQIRELQPRPNLPHSDYVGLMDDIYGYIGVQAEAEALQAGAFPVPAQYRPGTAVHHQIADDVKNARDRLTSGKFVGVANRVFFSLVGRWQFSRTVEGKEHDADTPSIAAEGSAEFDASQSFYKYRYSEHSDTMSNGVTHSVDEHVEYSLHEAEGKITVSMVGKSNTQNLYTLEFLAPQPEDKSWKARGQYSAADGSGQHQLNYEFYFTGSFMSTFSVTRTDHGSAADGAKYVSKTSYKRPLPAAK